MSRAQGQTHGRAQCRSGLVQVALALLALALLTLPLALLAGCDSGPATGGARPTATGGALNLTTDKRTYAVHDPIGVTVANTGGGDLYARDGRSACTFVQLQRYDTGKAQWVSVDGCSQAETSPRPLVIHGGMSEPFTLAPGSPSDPNAWEPGLYRVGCAYGANPDGSTGEQIAYSAGFTISG
jgi:hypothetical protein